MFLRPFNPFRLQPVKTETIRPASRTRDIAALAEAETDRSVRAGRIRLKGERVARPQSLKVASRTAGRG